MTIDSVNKSMEALRVGVGVRGGELGVAYTLHRPNHSTDFNNTLYWKSSI